ncbi:ester cyclase [Micromonospora arida]|uniref:Ester cyclase n=1 Tax=Micromonospora zamorensis TaxID=709883 RepID=A0ABZ1PHW7_9ACTN|nr:MULTISPECIES: ester cyclase [Micromonospora]NJC11414.1 putative ester cyclase [Micromonospora profundi]
MSEANKRIVRNYFEELDGGRTTPVHLCTEDFRFHPAGLPTLDIDGVKVFGDAFFTGMTDLQHPLDELIADGDLVALRCRYEGTHDGELMGVPATGRQVSAVGIGVMRVADGKIAEFWVSPDRMTIMQQIGAIPS